MSKYFFAFITIFFFSTAIKCQSLDSLSILIKDIQKGKNDSVRIHSNDKFQSEFEKILLGKGSFSRNFDSLKNISVQEPDDKSFRIYTWTVPHFDGMKYDYFGFIQVHSADRDSLFRLADSSGVIQKPESEKLRTDRWLGCVYYSIITVKKSDKNYYTLLGWKGKDEKETQKIIDVLYFTGKQIRMGYPLFKTGSVFRNRMIFTFNAQIAMTLHYDKNFDGIVFDHFSVNKNNVIITNGPDGSYDAFKWKKGKWILNTDVDVRTKWNPNEKLPVPPPVEK